MFSSFQLYVFRLYQTGQGSSYVEEESGMDASEDGSGEDGSSFGAGMCSLFLTSLELLYFSQFISVSYSRNEFCTNQESQIALEEPNHKCAQRCIKKWASGFRHRFESSYEHIALPRGLRLYFGACEITKENIGNMTYVSRNLASITFAQLLSGPLVEIERGIYVLAC